MLFNRCLTYLILFIALLGSRKSYGHEGTPDENKTQNVMPAIDSAAELVQSLLQSLRQDDASSAKVLFFPEKPFLALKDVKNPKAYYDELIKEYESQQRKLRSLVKGKDVKYLAFKKGHCKWKQVGSEYNHIAYWSCYKNTWQVTVDGKTITLPIRTMINWGPRWYITHLGQPL